MVDPGREVAIVVTEQDPHIPSTNVSAHWKTEKKTGSVPALVTVGEAARLPPAHRLGQIVGHCRSTIGTTPAPGTPGGGSPLGGPTSDTDGHAKPTVIITTSDRR